MAYSSVMNILFTNFLTSPGIDGHTIYIATLARALSARHTITVAAPAGSGLYRRVGEIPGVQRVAQSFPNRIHHMLAAARQFRRLINDNQFDVIHVNGSADHRLAIVATRGMGASRPRIIFTKHNDHFSSRFGSALRARMGTDYVIGVCEFVHRQLEKSPFAICPIDTVYNGIDTQVFAPRPREDAFALAEQWAGRKLAPGTLILGSNAGTGSYKGWQDMITAVGKLADPIRRRVHIFLAGELPTRAQRQFVTDAGMTEHVTFVGRLDDVRPLVACFDIGFVLSYRVETISFACREMMAMGIPVILTDHGGLPENVTNGREGWIVPKRDTDAIAARVLDVLNNRSLLSLMGIAARERSVRQFGVEQFILNTEAVYRKAVARERGARVTTLREG